jgi:Predicted permeases
MSIFDVYLPVAGIHFNILLLVLIGFCVGVLGGFFGVGGGWMITPALNIFGFHMAFAIGTPLANIFGQSIGAVRKHQKMGNIDWKLGLLSIVSSVIGVELGSRLIITLEKIGDVGFVVRWCYVVLLSSLGLYMLYEYFVLHPASLRKMKESDKLSESDHPLPGRTKISERLLSITIPPMISLPVSGIESVSIWVILIVFLLTGFISGFMGVGGGFIILPVLVYLIGLPTTIAVGTSLVTVLFTAGYGCFTYGLKGRVELIAAFIMLIGASVGAQIGATAIKFIRGYGIRLLFAIMVIFASLSVLAEQFYKMASMALLQTIAGIVLMGTALTMTVIIIGKIIIESKREMK